MQGLSDYVSLFMKGRGFIMTIVPKEDFQKKFRYHHGHLRESLLAAALDILAQAGSGELSLRQLAKATGVSQAAPYTYFRDKDELLAAVAETGFQRLALQMAEDATGASSARGRIEKLVASYIRFARENKPLFQLMFGRELADMKKFPTLAMTAGKSYALISAALATRTAGKETGDTRFLTVAIWSLCHGLTTLLVEERLKPEDFGAATADDFVRRTVDLFAAQLG
jgi:AcrR family transcriptional regulator